MENKVFRNFGYINNIISYFGREDFFYKLPENKIITDNIIKGKKLFYYI